MFETAECSFYGALAHAALCHVALPEQQAQHLAPLEACQKQLQMWAEHCAENFEDRATLVGAEIARIYGRTLDAMSLYEQAIRSAQANGFVHNEALANELAAGFTPQVASSKSPSCICGTPGMAISVGARWARCVNLMRCIRVSERKSPRRAMTSTIAASVEHLDLSTVIKVSQAISGEVVLDKLVETLMRIAIEQAGAERGLLIFSRGAEQRIAAEAVISGDMVTTHLRDVCIDATVLPESVLHYVLRTRESVILDNAAQSPFAADPYYPSAAGPFDALPALAQSGQGCWCAIPREQPGTIRLRACADRGA